MLRIDVRADIRSFERTLDNVQRRQIPFATANALNATARAVQAEERRELPSVFDRPTPFTLNSIGIVPARKDRLEARVFVKDKQASYLGLQETGGTRLPAKRALVLPARITLNTYGNMPKGAIKRAIARRDVFVGKVKGMAGIWQRPKDGQRRAAPGRMKLLASFEPVAQYRPRLGFVPRAEEVATAAFPREMRVALAKALATAKP
ncbi:hypothetical protein M0638_07035 [Roseomonas sp. NAR14]|uniref:Uncharacterized protein n=1 Tax=Roseomonas acroporae TaxID=2937791 RepID=A0A9X1Y4N0_9PROT|nr:hypothetical protein [Roseomonas acroporae]MCK8784129.1 hypothetical protein [Roseomonas acroporae]